MGAVILGFLFLIFGSSLGCLNVLTFLNAEELISGKLDPLFTAQSLIIISSVNTAVTLILLAVSITYFFFAFRKIKEMKKN